MNPGSDLDSLPILDTPDKLVVHAYAAHIGELLYIANNTVPQLSYSMSCLTRYMSTATPTRFTYAKVVLRYLIGIKGRRLTWCCKPVSLPHVLGEFFVMSIQVGLMPKITSAALWLMIPLLITLRFLGVRLFLKLWPSTLPRLSL